MGCECLIVANPKLQAGWSRGDVCVVKDQPCVWGAKEGPPNWVRLVIADATKAQVDSFLVEWSTGVFTATVQVENANGYRVRIEVDPGTISLGGLNKSVKIAVRDYLQNTWNASIRDYGDDYAVVDIPKPVDLLQVRAGLHDVFHARFAMRRYYFSSDDVDYALSQGGVIELTRDQALSHVKDRLAE